MCRPVMDPSSNFGTAPSPALSVAQSAFVALGCVALAAICNIYYLAHAHGHLYLDPDWSISRSMARPYNEQHAQCRLLPSFLAMIGLYAYQHQRKPHVLKGAAFAAVGAVGLFRFDALAHEGAHFGFVAVLVVGAYYWKRDLLPWQAASSCAGFAVGVSGLVLMQLTGSFLFGSMIGVGELMILFTWASMIFNA